jgi:TrpR family transcriptional regulator, trp operon repressor
MKKYFDELIRLFVKTKDSKKMRDLLKSVLTPREIEAIGNRLAIAKMLKKGISQREIAKRLGVGIATVTRGSREIKLKKFKNV